MQSHEYTRIEKYLKRHSYFFEINRNGKEWLLELFDFDGDVIEQITQPNIEGCVRTLAQIAMFDQDSD